MAPPLSAPFLLNFFSLHFQGEIGLGASGAQEREDSLKAAAPARYGLSGHLWADKENGILFQESCKAGDGKTLL